MARILVVEDEEAFSETICTVLREISTSVEITVARSKEASLSFIESSFYDLIVLDLKIPANDGQLDTDPQHGFAVFTRAKALVSGTPLFVLTGSPAEDFITELIQNTRQIDIWGEGKKIGTVDFLPKHKFDQFPGKIKPTLEAIDALFEVELEKNGIDLSIPEDRLTRIFARHFGARHVLVSALGGGLSGAKVLRLRTTDSQGARVHDAVAKLGTLVDVTDEGGRFDNLVSRLESRATPRKLITLEAGAGSHAGVFYALAEGFNQTAFEAASGSASHIQSIILSIEEGTKRWREGVPQSRRQISDVRRNSISDEKLAPLLTLYPLDWINDFESKQIQVRWSCTHGDLHGENILVAEDGTTVLIDYGDVGEATACLDSITLELSLIFHPKSPYRKLPNDTSGWPSIDQAKSWGDIDTYVINCPVENFVRACRAWSHRVSAGQRELTATAYAYLLRQLKYEGTNKDIALSLLNGVKATYEKT